MRLEDIIKPSYLILVYFSNIDLYFSDQWHQNYNRMEYLNRNVFRSLKSYLQENGSNNKANEGDSELGR